MNQLHVKKMGNGLIYTMYCVLKQLMNEWILNYLSKVKVIYNAVDFVLIGKIIFNCKTIPKKVLVLVSSSKFNAFLIPKYSVERFILHFFDGVGPYST